MFNTIPQRKRTVMFNRATLYFLESRKNILKYGTFILLFFLHGIIQSQTQQIFTTSGSWTCPAGVTSVSVECWGGGGGGGAATGTVSAGGGGAGGSYVSKTVTVTPGTTYTIVVGNGGVGGNISDGGSGGSSYFNTLLTLSAIGGGGGSMASTSNSVGTGALIVSSGNSGGTIDHYGGNGGNGTGSGSTSGAGGASGSATIDGGDASGSTAGIAGAGGGNGAAGSTVSADGAVATQVGGGGAGGRAGSSTDRKGGSGAAGKVIISTTNTLWYNTITGTNPNLSNPYTSGDVVASNLTVSGIGRGSGLTSVNNNDRYTASGLNSIALNTSDYFQFTLTPASGYVINLNNFSYTGQISTGTATLSLRSSLDNYAASIGTASVNGSTISLSASAYQALSSAITFRLYVWGTAASGTTYSINDFSFGGALVGLPTLSTFSPTSACSGSGSSIQITGTNLGSTSAVKFNGVSATFTVNSATSVSATLPAGATTGVVSITTSAGTVSSATSFTVSALPAPSFTAQGAASVCGNVSVTYTAQTGQSNYAWNVPGVAGTDYTILSGGIGSTNSTVSLKWLTGGNKTVTINYANASGCSASTPISSTVTLVDNSAPVIACPSNISANTVAGGCATSVSTTNPTSSDNCAVTKLTWSLSGATIGNSASAGLNNLGTYSFNIGVTTVTYTATDAANNSSTCSFTVTINDIIAPTITCPASQTVTLNGSCAGTLGDYRSLATVADNCTAVSSIVVTQIPSAGSTVSGSGYMLVALTATDASGNSSTCNLVVKKAESIIPVMVCPANITATSATGVCGANVSYTLGMNDNCSVGPCAPPAIAGYTLIGTLNGHTYFRSNTSFLPGDLASAIATTGGHLATISNATEDAFLNGIGSHYIGFNDVATEGNFAWANDEVVTYSNWNAGEPNDSGSEDWGAINWGGTTYWNDYAGYLPYVLEFDCTYSLSAGLPSESLFPIGTTTVTYTAIDGQGNTSTPSSFTVTVTDNIAPVVNCPPTVNATTGVGNTTCSVPVTYTLPSAFDNCGSCTTAPAISGYSSLGVFQGNAYYVSTSALLFPAAVTAASSIGGQIACIQSTAENNFIRNAANALGIGNYMIGFTDQLTEGSFVWANGQPVTYTNWYAGEPNNVSNEDYTQVYTSGYWNDMSGSSIYIIEVGCIPVSLSSGTASGGLFSVGTNQVTYSSTDASGNIGTCSFNVVVTDNTVPTISCPAPQTVVLGAGCAGVLGDYRALATVSDNCTPVGSLVITQSPAVGSSVTGVGTTVVTLTVADAAGNTASCTLNALKVDTTNPTISCSANTTVSAGASGCTASVATTNPTFADNCGVTKLTWSLTGATVAASLSTGINYVGTRVFNSGVTTVTYMAKDAANNSATCTFTVTVNETTNPVITCPAVQTLVLNNSGTAIFPDYRSLASISDNCTSAGAMIISQSPPAGSTVTGVGTTAVTITATDAAGNHASCTFNVNRVDTTPPVAICHNTTVPLTANGTAVITPTMINNGSTDNFGIASMSVNPNTFTCSGSGETTVVSSSGYTIHINVVPTTINPVSMSCQFGYSYTVGLNYSISFTGSNIPSSLYTLQGKFTVNGTEVFYDLPNNGGSGTTTSALAFTTNTNCATATPSSLGISNIKVELDGPGITAQTIAINTSNVVTLTVVDNSGNSTTCTALVTVQDNIPPTVVCPTNMIVNASAGCNTNVVVPNPTITDNCGVAKITWTMSGATQANSPTSGMNYVGTYQLNVGTTIITYTATDNSGNVQSNAFQVTTNNTTAPIVNCPITQTLIHNTSCSTALPDYRLLLTVSDDCTPITDLQIVQSPAPGTLVTGTGTTTVNFLVTDLNGNSNTCLFIVQHVDNLAPIIHCPANQSVTLNSNGQAVLGNYKPLMSGTDACNTPLQLVYTQVPASGTPIQGTTPTTVTMYGADLSGNTSECTFIVQAIDNTAPQITCPATQQLILGSGNTGVLGDYTALAVITDNASPSSGITILQSPIAGSVVTGEGILPVTITATDASGNVSSCTFNVNKMAQTKVAFAIGGGSFNEASGDFTIAVAIVNPSSNNPTQITFGLSSGDVNRLSNFNTQTVIFPAGSAASQTVTLHLYNNTLCDVNPQLVFALSNVSGGNSAAIGSLETFTLNIVDDEVINAVSLNDNIEDGNISDWYQPTSGQWLASNASSLNGGYSIKHGVSAGSGQSVLAYDIHKLPISGVNTEWKFNLSHFNQEPDQNDLFMVYLASNSTDMHSLSCSGYAIGVNPSSVSDPDIIKLWRVVNGVPVQEIVNTGYDLGALDNQIGWRITRSDAGEWSVYLDHDGGFDNLQSAGTGVDRLITRADYFGVFYRYTSATAGKLAIDDISMKQTACSCTYYSQSSGAQSDVLWSTNTIGTPISKESSRYTNFVIQSGHNVTLSNTMYAKDVQVLTSGTLSTGASELTLYGNLAVNGTLNCNDGQLTFRGDLDQTVTGLTSLTLNNLEIDNTNHHVTLNPGNETFIKGVATIKQGTLVTNDNLVLISNPTTNGSVGTISDGADLTGKITMQRYVPALTNYPNGGYVGLGCAVQGATLMDWNDDIITTGFAGSDYPPPYSFNNISWYNESVAGSFNNGYVYATNITNPLYSDRGYFVFTQSGVQNLEVKGDIYKHDFNKALSYTNTGSAANDGYNLLVNQYPSEVDFKLMANNGSGVSSYTVFDAESNNYKAYNAITNSGNATRYIAASQSFFVKVSAPNAFLKYREVYKTHNGVSFERGAEETEANPPSQVVFKISSENLSADEAVLTKYVGATSNYDTQFDVAKMYSPYEEAVACALVSSDDQQLTIDSRQEFGGEMHIPIFVKLPQAGSYIFSVSSISNMVFEGCICVEDVLTGNTIRLEAGQSLTLTTNEAYEGNRLMIRGVEATHLITNNNACHGQHSGSIQLQEIDPSAMVTVTDFTLHEVYNGSGIAEIPGLAAGDYLVRINYPSSHCPAEEIAVEITEPLPASVILSSGIAGDCDGTNNASLEVEIQNIPGYSYQFLSSEDVVVYAGTSSNAVLTLRDIPADLYTVMVEGECGVQSITADLRDPDAVKAVILSNDIFVTVVKGSDQMLTVEQDSENAEYYEWKLGDTYTSHEEEFSYKFTSKGDYDLALKAMNDRCEDTKKIKIYVDEADAGNDDGFTPVSLILSAEYMMFFINQSLPDDLHLSVFDVSGRVIWSFTTQSTEGKRIETGISHYAPGVYFVKGMVDGHEVLNKKIMK